MLAVETTRLYLQVAPSRRICNGLFLSAPRGTITAIMGPAGCGKSVLLKLLVGYEHPTLGYVQIGGARLDRDFNMICDRIGYVPQAEIMIPELTVGRSLDYRLRLRFSGMVREERQHIVQETCQSLGFDDLAQVLAKRIGTAESKGEFPSGGERRRVNIAHELLTRPEVLFLDEPTTGLASADAETVVAQLRELADGGLTVIVTIHQPSQIIFDWIDDLLLVGWGGQLAYYGTAQEAVGYFQRISNLQLHPRQNPAEYLLDFVRKKELSEWAVRKFSNLEASEGQPHLKTKPPLPLG